jgi:integral membrane protein (TIGR01906 family)
MRASWPLAFLLGIASAVLIMLLGPLALFNPLFAGTLQARHDVPQLLGTSASEVDRVTAQILGEVHFGGDFLMSLDGGEPLLDAEERSHMQDVSGVVRLLWLTAALAAALAVAVVVVLRREPRRIGRALLIASAAIGATAIVLALVFAFAFDAAFTAFHQIFFQPGTWQFGPESNLIRLFPQPFWFDAALAAGASIVLVAVVVALIGWRLWRAIPSSPEP